MPVPIGLTAIKETYGNPRGARNKVDATWYSDNIERVNLPFPMRCAWSLGTVVTSILVHRKAKAALIVALTNVWNHARVEVKKIHGYDKCSEFYDREALAWLQERNLDIFGGSYVFRAKRGSSDLSIHSWGIAVDIDPAHNVMRTAGTLPAWYVKCWVDAGWLWGGRWKGKSQDPMHFQLAAGY